MVSLKMSVNCFQSATPSLYCSSQRALTRLRPPFRLRRFKLLNWSWASTKWPRCSGLPCFMSEYDTSSPHRPSKQKNGIWKMICSRFPKWSQEQLQGDMEQQHVAFSLARFSMTENVYPILHASRWDFEGLATSVASFQTKMYSIGRWKSVHPSSTVLGAESMVGIGSFQLWRNSTNQLKLKACSIDESICNGLADKRMRVGLTNRHLKHFEHVQ